MIVDRSTSEDDDHWRQEPSSKRLHPVSGEVTIDEWSARFGQQATTILLTGLTGAGKTTIANALQRRLFDEGRVATVIDGQNMRTGLSRDLGFSVQDRSENLRRCVEVARFMNQAGLICICAFVAPSDEVRQRLRPEIGDDRFFMAYVSAPLEICRGRDKGGIYEAADAGEIANVPGVTTKYEPPEDADLVLPTDEWPVDKCVDALMELLRSKKRIG